jgi:hypothetical protein
MMPWLPKKDWAAFGFPTAPTEPPKEKVPA